MIKIIDYFFFKIYQIGIWGKKNEDSARFSACATTGVLISFFMFGFVAFCGVIYPNPVSASSVEHRETILVVGTLLCLSMTYSRYYRSSILDETKASYYRLSKSKRRLLSIFIYINSALIVPFNLLFVRLGVLGYHL